MGAVVLVVAVGFLMFVYNSTQVGTVAGYEIVAKFDRVDGLGVGSDVRVGGIKVGTVTDQFIEPETFLAVVRMSVDPALHMPSDSSAAIVSNGLLGEKYLALTPGAEEDVLGRWRRDSLHPVVRQHREPDQPSSCSGSRARPAGTTGPRRREAHGAGEIRADVERRTLYPEFRVRRSGSVSNSSTISPRGRANGFWISVAATAR